MKKITRKKINKQKELRKKGKKTDRRIKQGLLGGKKKQR
jgi:hypothetical protein